MRGWSLGFSAAASGKVATVVKRRTALETLEDLE